MFGGIAAGSSAKTLAGLAGKALPVIGNVLGGLFGSSGQDSANRMNYRIAQENRAFQERMSSTAYQRAAQDLQKAGLNRILALGSPASTPTGATAKMENTKAMLGQAVQTAALTAAQIGLIKAQTTKAEAEAKAIAPKAEIGGSVAEIITTAKERSGTLLDSVGKGSQAIISGGISNRPTAAKPATQRSKTDKQLIQLDLPTNAPRTWLQHALDNTRYDLQQYHKRHGRYPDKAQIQRLFDSYYEESKQ